MPPPAPPDAVPRALTLFLPETLSHDIWVRITSRSPLKGVLNFGTRDDQTLVTIPMMEEGAGEIVFPYVYISDYYYTGITLINTGFQEANVTLEAYSENGVFLTSQTVTVGPRAKYVRLVNGIFDYLNANEIRFIRVHSDQELIGFELFGSFYDNGLAGLPAFYQNLVTSPKDAPESHMVYYNMIAGNDDYLTGVTVSNLAEQPTQVNFTLRGLQGQDLAHSVWEVNPLQQVTREIWNVFDGTIFTDASYLQADSASSILGFELSLTRSDSGLPFQFDGLLGLSSGADLLYFPLVQPAGDWENWLRLTNVENISNAVEIHAFNTQGQEIDLAFEVIDPFAQIREPLSELFPGLSQDIAWLRVTSAGQIIGDLMYISSDQTRMSCYLGLPGSSK